MLRNIVKFIRDRISRINKSKKKARDGKKDANEAIKSHSQQKPSYEKGRQTHRSAAVSEPGVHKPGHDKRSGERRSPGKPSHERQGQQPRQEKVHASEKPLPRKPRKEGVKPHSAEAAPEVQLPDNWDPAEFKVEPETGKTRFHDLNLPKEIMHAIYDLGFKYCTPIQSEIMFNTLAGKDATGRAQTGTGKTAAFLITIFASLLRNPLQGKRATGTPRALILAPTRELVMQIASDAFALSKYTGLNITSVYGGMDYQKQRRMLHGRPIDVLVATPGRLIDFHNKHDVHLSKVEILVIDEADRMLDMGFIPDVRRIVRSTPPKEKRQTLFFSATLTPDVLRLASYWTNEAVQVEIEPEQVTVDTVEQKLYIVTSDEKFPLLYNVITKENLERVIVFANRRDETRDLFEKLQKYGISCSILSGDIDQRQRVRTLDDFKNGRIKVLVATDVAGRGIHIEGVSHVINYTLPEDPEDYVHRIGRTGRAGAKGISISFASEDDSFNIPAIEKFIGRELQGSYPDEGMLAVPEKPQIKQA